MIALDDPGKEISDLIIDYDIVSHERLPVSKNAVLSRFRQQNNAQAIKVVEQIPAPNDLLDADAVDEMLLRSHYELQRVSELFEQGRRVLTLLKPLIESIRKVHTDRIRIVDIGCGTGYVIRWLADQLGAETDIELIGTDYNKAFIEEASLLAKEEQLKCKFITANAFALDFPAHIFISTGVLHHFRDAALVDFFANQKHSSLLAAAHFDFQSLPFSPAGSWLFHEILMREPLAKHDGVLSSKRAHKKDILIAAAQTALPEYKHEIYKDKLWGIPFLPRAMHALLTTSPKLHSARSGAKADE